MGETTPISWCDSTLNLEMGCDGCELWNALRHSCYAGVATDRYAGGRGWPSAFSRPTVFPDRLGDALRWHDMTGLRRQDKPWLDGYPRIVFLDDMGDTFTESLDLMWLRPFLERMERSPHVWLPLTKWPRRAAEFFRECGVPRNFWVGTSVTDQATAAARIPALQEISARVHFVSVEPLLERVDLKPLYRAGSRPPQDPDVFVNLLHGIDWVIVGGESGEGFRPMDPAWAASVRDQCVAEGVPFFFKQSSGRFSETSPVLAGREWRQMPGWSP